MKKHIPEASEISDLLDRDLKGLCASCIYSEVCSFRMETMKEIIQCEFYSMDDERNHDRAALNGLCRTCDKAYTCKLPGRLSGVWRCDEYT